MRFILASMLITSAPGVAAQEHPAEALPQEGTPTFQGFLFGDVTYLASKRGGSQGFLAGQLVGHGNARLSDRLTFFGELSASARENTYLIEVERAILRYDFADELKLSAGRYHTPVSYWNTAYHHGLWLQTSVARPEIIRIGGTFLPVHFVGAMMEGTFSSRVGSLTYAAGAGNGRGTIISRAGDAGDVNSNRATVFSVGVRPRALSGLGIGGSLYNDRVPMDSVGVGERILTGHVVWDHGAPEIIAEYAAIRHDAPAGDATTSDGFYVQAGVRLPGALWRLKPYGRFENMDIATDDAVFAPNLADYEAVIGGVRWDFEALATLKAEFRREQSAGGERLNSLYFQAALVVPSTH
ncbi:MAG TPA: hypothetical protein VF035_00565 [Longimicrobiales bacterium]